MDQAFKENIHHFMLGLGAVLVGVVALMFVLYFVIKRKAKAKKSRPASGAEHSLSHYWEITHPKSNERLALHGARTGAATGVIADLYEKIRCLSRAEVAKRLENANFPNPSNLTLTSPDFEIS